MKINRDTNVLSPRRSHSPILMLARPSPLMGITSTRPRTLYLLTSAMAGTLKSIMMRPLARSVLRRALRQQRAHRTLARVRDRHAR